MTDKTEDGGSFRPYPSNGICAKLGDKWTAQVLWQLSHADGQKLRYSALKSAMDGITQRMLTLTLRNLERDGILRREVFDTKPPSVTYSLSELGEGFLPHLLALVDWAETGMPDIVAARQRFDAV